jgi:hypothetical protein
MPGTTYQSIDVDGRRRVRHTGRLRPSRPGTTGRICPRAGCMPMPCSERLGGAGQGPVQPFAVHCSGSPWPAHTTNPIRRPGIAQVFYECGTLPILSSRVSHPCIGQPFAGASNGADEEKVAHVGAFARQGNPRHRPPFLCPEPDTLAETLTPWPWVICGPVLHRCGGRRGPRAARRGCGGVGGAVVLGGAAVSEEARGSP